MHTAKQSNSDAKIKKKALGDGRFLIRPRPPSPTPVFDTYWNFAAERQAIFFRRHAGLPGPWTTDPILSTYKFTNAYRASDRVSQFLIKTVLHGDDHSLGDVFLRVMLFKFFNKIETWQLLEDRLGEIKAKTFSFDKCRQVLTKAKDSGTRIYSAAYIMPSGASSYRCQNKHSMNLMLLEKMLSDKLPEHIAGAKGMEAAFLLLRSYPTIGDFLAYQYITDLNYSEYLNFSEMEFVAAGPGARDGLKKCFSDFGGYDENGVIRWVTERQDSEFAKRGIRFQTLWGRPLQLIDCQNLFCETGKYARIAHPESIGSSGRKRIKQKFKSNPERLDFSYPSKWHIKSCDFLALG